MARPTVCRHPVSTAQHRRHGEANSCCASPWRHGEAHTSIRLSSVRLYTVNSQLHNCRASPHVVRGAVRNPDSCSTSGGEGDGTESHANWELCRFPTQAGRIHVARRLAARQLKLRLALRSRRRATLQCQAAVSTAGPLQLLQHETTLPLKAVEPESLAHARGCNRQSQGASMQLESGRHRVCVEKAHSTQTRRRGCRHERVSVRHCERDMA